MGLVVATGPPAPPHTPVNFDLLAPFYRMMEPVLAGRTLHAARTAHLGRLRTAGRILLAGEGPGRFLESALTELPDAHITCLDASAAMLSLARQTVKTRPAWAGRVEFIQADLRTWEPVASPFDAIVTSCVLDCFSPASLPTVVNRLARAASPTADWIVIDFRVPDHGWRRVRATLIHRLMYAFFRLTTRLEARRLTSPDPWILAAGFSRIDRRTFNAGLLVSEHWRRLEPPTSALLT